MANFKIVSWSGHFYYLAPRKRVVICEDTGNREEDKRLIGRFLEGIGANGWDGEVEW